MNRELTNRIRFVLEELLPPILRDSAPMRWLFRRHWGGLIDEIEVFRERAHYVSDAEYAAIYTALPRIHEETDLSEACVTRILDSLEGPKVLDVGCGTGVLLQRIAAAAKPGVESLAGLDFQIDDALRSSMNDVRLEESKIEQLPFEDAEFDTVICTHVLEHILDIRAAVAELRRICRSRLIIVVPKERECRFTFNPHLHFFAYPHSFLRHMLPVPADAVCEQIGRDFFYTETIRR